MRTARILALAAIVTAAAAPAALASSSGVVVSQVYGGGGNSGAPLTNDFVELFNAGTAAVSVDGWSIQYASATGTGNLGANDGQLTVLAGSIAPGARMLVQEAAGATPSGALPAPDITDPTAINLSGTAGKVALVDQTATVGCNGGSTPCTPAQRARILDLVGYGSANFFEGTAAAPTLSNATAALRDRGGCDDSDDNAADFSSQAPQPRNSSAPPASCSAAAIALASSSPSDDASGVALDADITLTFNRPVTVDPGFATLACDAGGAHPFAVSGSGATRTLNPDADFVAGDACTLTVRAGAVHDAADPANTLPADRTVRFSAITAATPIRAIQGAGHISPLRGATVRTLGIVTARRSNGFWMQDPQADDDPATSEGIFVFTGAAPAALVGDAVDVTGSVAEFRAGGAANLTLTELTGPAVSVLSSGNALPGAQLVGPGGRSPSSTIIEDDASNVELDGLFDPAQDGIDFYESLEGMRVRIDDAVASGPTSDFGSNREIPVLPGAGAESGLRTPRGGIIVRPDDFNPERIILNDIVSGGPVLPAANVGDRFPGTTVGVVDYAFSNFKLEVTELPGLAAGAIERETTTAAGAGELAFATFNVENLDPADGPATFDDLAGLIVENLRAPDVISLEEVQDSDGPVNSGNVDAAATYDTLAAAITAAGGPAYSYRQINPVNGRDGGQPGGNIRVGFLFRTDRGLSFVDRPGGDATTPVQVGPGPALSVSPGRIDPANPAFANSRKPLAGEFRYDGRTLFVVANHWNSKGGDQPLFGVNQPPVLGSEAQRVEQAKAVNGFVDALLAQDPDARVAVLGDLNDFSFSAPLRTLAGDPPVLDDLITGLAPGERYTYVFQGNSQDLDHILFSRSLADDLAGFDVVHVNAEFADQASDHDPLVATACADITPPSLSVSLTPDRLFPPDHKYRRVVATPTATDSVDGETAIELVSVTSNEPDDAPGKQDGNTVDDVKIIDDTTFDLRAERDKTASGRVYTAKYQATDDCGNETTASATVTVPIYR